MKLSQIYKLNFVKITESENIKKNNMRELLLVQKQKLFSQKMV